ncbi:middle expressed protein 4 [Lactococcus phage 936 group phage Phi155]|uniref:Middle expressed protein 4 n=1 Tax=Lactococcus phage 936 group phage Phi155 TaxID=1636560 RepID=A0A126HDA6_9CAUD|nr:middle expressed protein 4 [Lactococcus phage 936 group phage Phi155]ALM64565.1 middle expressed protein 4 [Lactococcus phage 936 group phage Phi155]
MIVINIALVILGILYGVGSVTTLKSGIIATTI